MVAIVTGDYLIDEATSNALRDLGAVIHFNPLRLDDLVNLVHRLILDAT